MKHKYIKLSCIIISVDVINNRCDGYQGYYPPPKPFNFSQVSAFVFIYYKKIEHLYLKNLHALD